LKRSKLELLESSLNLPELVRRRKRRKKYRILRSRFKELCLLKVNIYSLRNI